MVEGGSAFEYNKGCLNEEFVGSEWLWDAGWFAIKMKHPAYSVQYLEYSGCVSIGYVLRPAEDLDVSWHCLLCVLMVLPEGVSP